MFSKNKQGLLKALQTPFSITSREFYFVEGKTLPDVEHLVEALKDGTVESILVDMYTPVKRKDLFNGSWFQVAMLLEAEISHGVLLQGSAVGLADELERIIVAQDVQTSYLQEENDIQKEEVKINNDVIELQSVCTHYMSIIKTPERRQSSVKFVELTPILVY